MDQREQVLRLLEGMWVNELKRTGRDGLINPSQERCAMLNEVSWALDQLLDLGNGDPVASANVWQSFRPSEANILLVQSLKAKRAGV